jgi:hypothetical protein
LTPASRKAYIALSIFGKLEAAMLQPSLRPLDVVVALHVALRLDTRYEAIAGALGISVSQAHRSVRRLEDASLAVPGSRKVNRSALKEFLLHGVRYAYYAVLGPETRGIPTAHSAPPLAGDIVAADHVVWPAAAGGTRGAALLPLYPGAVGLPERSPELYEALALVDALRVGRVRERKLAAGILEARLRGGA